MKITVLKRRPTSLITYIRKKVLNIGSELYPKKFVKRQPNKPKKVKKQENKEQISKIGNVK